MFNYLFNGSYNKPIDENHNIVPGKIGAYIINMDKAVERLKLVLPDIQHLGFPVERIAAVDGTLLENISDYVDIEIYRKHFKTYPEKGTIGCALSHEKTWRSFLSSDNEYALIFEDDVVFNPEILKNTVTRAVSEAYLWDILCMELIHNGTPVSIKENFVCYLTNVKHAGCYLVNRYAAKRFISKFYPIKMPLDHYFTASWEFDTKFLGVEPRVVRQRGLASQIKIGNKSKQHADLSVLIHNAWFNVKREIVNFVYNLIVYSRLKEK